MKKQSDNIPGETTPGISRRNFIKSAAGSTAVLASASTLPIDISATEKKVISKTRNPFNEVLSRCGSEFGNIRECN